jgi:hypothetical protein
MNAPISVYPASAQGASLRQIDWRFLLPSPPEGTFQHLVLFGGSAGLAERIIEVGLARRVSQEAPAAQSADALIILRQARIALVEAAHSLQPGGAFYYEVERRWPASWPTIPGQIKHSLRDAGLSPTGIYWAWPDFATRQVYLPLSGMEMLRWYLTSLASTATLARPLFQLTPRLLTWFGGRFFPLVARCCAVTAIAGPPSEAPPALLQHPLLPAELRQPGLLPLILTPGEDDLNRVAIFAGAADRAQPAVVLKFWRSPDQNAKTENEQATLAAIRAPLDKVMRQTIPEPRGVLRWGQLVIGIESCAPGRSLSASMDMWGTPLRQKMDDLCLITRWLTEFHRQVQIRRLRWDAPELAEWVEKPLAVYQQAFGMTADEQRLFGEARQCAAALVGLSSPMVWVHWGFSERNFFRADSKITIVDWESASPGPPLFDLLYFVTYWSYRVRRLRGDTARLRGFRKLFCEPADLVSIAAHQAIAQYMSKLDLDRRFLPLLLVLMWIERALGRYQRQGKPAEPGVARSRNAYVDYIGALAEYHDRLFAGTYEK